MSKVAIVGVEGSGKTVLMAALGEIYGQASHEGLYLMPENQAAFSFMTRIPHKMRVEHQWPEATAIESMKHLKWTVRLGAEVLTELEMLDYPGELYRMAFGDRKESEIEGHREQIHEFLEHLVTADFLIVLMNLKDAMDVSADSRNNETVWLTRGIFDYAKKLPNIKNQLLVFTQADRYRDLLVDEGGAKVVQNKYLPMLSILHPDLACSAISAIKAPESGGPGDKPNKAGGLQELMAQIVMASDSGRRAMELLQDCEKRATEAAGECSSLEELERKIETYGISLSALGRAEVGVICTMFPGTLDKHSKRHELLQEIAKNVRRVVAANSTGQLSRDDTWGPLADAYKGLTGPVKTIQNIKNAYAIRSKRHTATIVAVGLLSIILIGGLLGGRYYKQSRAIDQLTQATALPRDICSEAFGNNAKAQYEVGKSFLVDGPGKNRSMAVEWLGKAALHGNEAAQNMLCDLYHNASSYLNDMPHDVRTLEFFTVHAQQSTPWAQYILGSICSSGLGAATNDEEALRWYRLSAKGGNVYGMINAARLLMQSTTMQDAQEAAKWLQQAAFQGAAEAQNLLGMMYISGVGVEHNDAQAKKWLQKAATQGYSRAMANLASHYLTSGDEKDTEKAFILYTEAADKGEADAQLGLGEMFANGVGVAKNEAEAITWYLKAATQGNATAQFNLGMMYQAGRGATKDETVAANWFHKAANQGSANAQFNLGLMYETGLGVPKNEMEAAKWYRQAADQGHVGAQVNLGGMYGEGRGVAKDEIMAAEFYRKAAAQGNGIAQVNLGYIYGEGRGVAKDEAMAVEYYRKAAEQGNGTAQFNLGWMCENGRGTPKDEVEAAKWYRQAAEQGHYLAQWNIGRFYQFGQGVPKDEAESANWYLKAAEQGYAAAQSDLGEMIMDGRGIVQDYAKAVEWNQRAAAQGDVNSQFNLGRMYENGWGVVQDYAQALIYYRKAAGSGNNEAQYKIGFMLAKGIGVEKNAEEAVQWLQKSAQNGFARAQTTLGEMYFDGQDILQNYGEAVNWFRKAAEQRDSWGQICFGAMYANGTGVSQNTEEAVKWFRLAAMQGEALAQNWLGLAYYSGKEVPKDQKEAFKWYLMAAEQGDTSGQLSIGNMYAEGNGVAQDDAQAVKWYRKAAEQGYPLAQLSLGRMYAEGRGVTQDSREAELWYQKAAAHNDPLVQLTFGTMFSAGQGVAMDQAAAVKWYRRAAEQGNSTAQFLLGTKLASGHGVAKNDSEAVKWGAKGMLDLLDRKDKKELFIPWAASVDRKPSNNNIHKQQSDF